jgi:hypothetical protein
MQGKRALTREPVGIDVFIVRARKGASGPVWESIRQCVGVSSPNLDWLATHSAEKHLQMPRWWRHRGTLKSGQTEYLMPARAAEIGYSKELHRIEVLVPHGTKAAELGVIMSNILSGGIIGRLPRPCTTCTSGDHWLVREALESTISVDLDKKA